MDTPQHRKQFAVVTGASRGIGKELARHTDSMASAFFAASTLRTTVIADSWQSTCKKEILASP